ncbi:MAG: SRPBCC domain-containing protein [Gemmatimonadaceae bacterium]
MTTTASPNRATITTPMDRVIHIERIFNASRDRVWRAHTDPKLVVQWWGRGNMVIERDEVERGGHWRYVEDTPEGRYGFEGRYREVTPQERISRTFEWDAMPGYVIVETTVFEDLGDGRTKLTTDSLFHTTEERDGMLEAMDTGVDESYDALDRLLATMK